MNEPKTRERSGLQKVKCRVCKKEINQQSYSEHIKSQHPEEKSDDLRAAGQGSLARWAGAGGVKRKLLSEKGDEGGVTMEEATGPTDVGMQVEDTVEVKEEEEEMEDDKEREREEERVDPEDVRIVLQQMLTKEDAIIDLTDCKTETEKLNKCLNILKKRLEIKDDVKSLVDNLKDLKMTDGELKVEKLPDRLDEDAIIRLARSLEEITENVVSFMYLDNKQQISCVNQSSLLPAVWQH